MANSPGRMMGPQRGRVSAMSAFSSAEPEQHFVATVRACFWLVGSESRRIKKGALCWWTPHPHKTQGPCQRRQLKITLKCRCSVGTLATRGRLTDGQSLVARQFDTRIGRVPQATFSPGEASRISRSPQLEGSVCSLRETGEQSALDGVSLKIPGRIVRTVRPLQPLGRRDSCRADRLWLTTFGSVGESSS